MKKINLKKLGVEVDSKFKYIAVDRDGDIYAYEAEPYYSHGLGQWLSEGRGQFEIIEGMWRDETFNLPPKDSLFEIDNDEDELDYQKLKDILFPKKSGVSCLEDKDSIYFLNKATETQSSRAGEYDTVGEKERNMRKIVDMFNACTGKSLTEAEGYLFMECLKNVRLFNAPEFHEDSAVDGVSYSSLKAEAKAREHGL